MSICGYMPNIAAASLSAFKLDYNIFRPQQFPFKVECPECGKVVLISRLYSYKSGVSWFCQSPSEQSDGCFLSTARIQNDTNKYSYK